VTVSLWMKRSGFSNPWEALIAKGDSSWAISRYNSTRNATFTSFSPSADDLRGTRTIDDGAWNHVAIVYDGSLTRLYVDASSTPSARLRSRFKTTIARSASGTTKSTRPPHLAAPSTM
jgi:hypothetical protein